jgi:hypothetical protein
MWSDPPWWLQWPFAHPGTLTVTSHFTDNIVRVGLNYQIH